MNYHNHQPVFLIDGCRSPIGKGHPEKGIYKNLRADELAVRTLKAFLERTGIDPLRIDDFFLGCAGQHREQGKNLARLVLLLAGLPDSIPGVTINRLCASGLTALQFAADSIRSGTNRSVLVGGVEHMGHVPMTAGLDYHQNLFRGYEFPWIDMGLTAEKLSEEFNITRREQDAYTLQSNRRYFRARETGFFNREIIPITLPNGTRISEDQEPRLSTPEILGQLRPMFKKRGTVTAANSSGVSDGCSIALVADAKEVEKFGYDPLAEIKATVTVGLDPIRMGLGPVPAIRELLRRTSLTLDDIDLFEINEAFAVQVLACQKELGLDSDRLNIHGGAVALGHPLGMSGLRLAVTLAHSLAAGNHTRGIAALCVGHGQGVAMLLERDS